MYRRLAMIMGLMFLTAISAGPTAAADDNSCWLEAGQNLYLSIYDLDSRGGILAHIWEGVLDQGSKKRIKSSNGKIRFYTSPGGLSISPGINKTCMHDEVMIVP